MSEICFFSSEWTWRMICCLKTDAVGLAFCKNLTYIHINIFIDDDIITLDNSCLLREDGVFSLGHKQTRWLNAIINNDSLNMGNYALCVSIEGIRTHSYFFEGFQLRDLAHEKLTIVQLDDSHWPHNNLPHSTQTLEIPFRRQNNAIRDKLY